MTERFEKTPIPYGLETMQPRQLEGEALPPKIHLWTAEPKWNGVRALAYITGEKVRIFTRTRQNVTRAIPIIRDKLAEQMSRKGEFVIDGEIIWEEGKSTEDRRHVIARLAGYEPRIQLPISFMAFDMPWMKGRDLRRLPISFRQRHLERFIPQLQSESALNPGIHSTPRTTKMSKYQTQILNWNKAGYEGFVLKRRGSLYASGPSYSWLKYKFKPQEQNPSSGNPQWR